MSAYEQRLGEWSALEVMLRGLPDPPPLDQHRPAWWAQAACRGVGVDLFFPERGADTRPARSYCDGCPVKDQCIDEALATRTKFGIWGGLSERQRRRIRKGPQRRLDAKRPRSRGWGSGPSRRRKGRQMSAVASAANPSR